MERRTTDLALVVLGLLAWVVAGLFGALLDATDTTAVAGGGTAHVRVPSVAAGGAAAGFAIAGGLCFLGAAFASQSRAGTPPRDA